MRLPLLFVALLIPACAPLALMRTPEPVEEGRARVGLGLGYSLALTQIPPCSAYPPQSCPPDGGSPGYEPIAAPFRLGVDQGLGGGGELNWGLEYGYLPGARLGYKRLLLSDGVKLAVEAGGSVYFSNWGLDLGLLGSVPLDGWEPYFAVRGFFTQPWGNRVGGLTAAGTLGGRVPLWGRDLFVELTLANGFFNGVGPSADVPRVGWSVVPAVGFRF